MMYSMLLNIELWGPGGVVGYLCSIDRSLIRSIDCIAQWRNLCRYPGKICVLQGGFDRKSLRGTSEKISKGRPRASQSEVWLDRKRLVFFIVLSCITLVIVCKTGIGVGVGKCN